MKQIVLFVAIMVLLFFISCKECKICSCWKDGVVYEETNCSYGFPPNTSTLNTWEDYLVEKMDYDSVKCVTE
jgi:hypothetical protein